MSPGRTSCLRAGFGSALLLLLLPACGNLGTPLEPAAVDAPLASATPASTAPPIVGITATAAPGLDPATDAVEPAAVPRSGGEPAARPPDERGSAPTPVGSPAHQGASAASVRSGPTSQVASPAHIDPAHAGPAHTGPAHTDPAEVGPAVGQPAGDDGTADEPVRAGTPVDIPAIDVGGAFLPQLDAAVLDRCPHGTGPECLIIKKVFNDGADRSNPDACQIVDITSTPSPNADKLLPRGATQVFTIRCPTASAAGDTPDDAPTS